MSPVPGAFEIDVVDGVCRCGLPAGRFLSTGFDGGVRVADAAYNVTVPDGWGESDRHNLRSYVAERLSSAGFTQEAADAACRAAAGTSHDGARDAGLPALLTGVDQRHARVARLDDVTVVATAGLSNPAALPIDDSTPATNAGRADVDDPSADGGDPSADGGDPTADDRPPIGTVNLLVGTGRDLEPGALANLVAVAAEAKATTLLATTGFPGTTSDAVVVACDPAGESTDFSGSATRVGSATRICVRDALLASLASRHASEPVADSVAEADHGVVADRTASVAPVVRESDHSADG